jgi:molecular chaperone GrpE
MGKPKKEDNSVSESAPDEKEIEVGNSSEDEAVHEEAEDSVGELMKGELGPTDGALEAAMKEALESVEAIEKDRGKAEGYGEPEEAEEEIEEGPPSPSKKELELKMQIIDLQHRIRELEKDVENRVKEIRQNYEEAKRIKQQFEDYKVRMMREKADFFNYGHEPLIKELLPIVDNLERGLDHAGKPEDFASLREGIDLTLRQCLKVLSKFGVKQIQALGEPFDPNVHEAMSMCEDDEAEPNTVVQEHQRGYMLKDRLIRPCLVTISRASESEAEKSEQAQSEKSKESAGEESPDKEESGAVEDKDSGE